MEKPTANECLDVLSILWHHSAEKSFSELIDKLNRSCPNWRTSRIPVDDKTAASMTVLKAWDRCKTILKRANRL